jgi:5-formyltetrahydrofolate cyclo-ligase
MGGVTEKRELRADATQRILEMPPEDRIVLDAQIVTHITHMPFWSEARTIVGYAAIDDEVDLEALLRLAVREGKRILLPRIEAGSREMRFLLVDDYPASLERHGYGFLQPPRDAVEVRPDSATMILVPGRVFDREGYRVGRGGGFYDRYLSGVSEEALTIGVGYTGQLVRSVPLGPGDVPVQLVVTDSETCFCRRSGQSN